MGARIERRCFRRNGFSAIIEVRENRIFRRGGRGGSFSYYPFLINVGRRLSKSSSSRSGRTYFSRFPYYSRYCIFFFFFLNSRCDTKVKKKKNSSKKITVSSSWCSAVTYMETLREQMFVREWTNEMWCFFCFFYLKFIRTV